MPTLKEYTEDSDQSGFYILANVGQSHPVTLQVTNLGKQILQKCGYESGDNVPTKIVWSMFDVGILYTSSTINEPPEVTEDTDEIFRQLNVANKLTSEERSRLINYLKEYSGPNEAQVKSLQNELQEQDTDKKDELPEEVQQDLERLSRLQEKGDITNEEYQLLKSRVFDGTELVGESKDSTKIGDESSSDVADWLPDSKVEEIIDAYWQLIPDTDDPYQEDTSDNNFDLDISALPDDSAVSPGFYGSPPTCVFVFTERQQENHLRERVENIESYRISHDLTDTRPPSVVVDFDVVSGEIREDFSDEDILEIIDHTFQTITQTYSISKSDILNGEMIIN